MPTDPSVSTVNSIVESLQDTPGALLPILHAVQDALGFIPADAVPVIAQGLNLSRAEVHGVISYYHHFRSEPAPRTVVQICRAEACQAMGGEALWAHACQQAGDAIGVEGVYCLGLCASSPAATVNDRPYARLNSDKLMRILNAVGGAA